MAGDRSVPVECVIHLGDRLTNPAIGFDVRVPGVDPEMQSIIANALSTPETVDTQFLYLLLFNSFMAENSAAGSNMGASVSAATGLEFLTNQLSNWLSADDYNLVIRYRPKSELTSDEVDFGLSKSLINNRLFVELEGNYIIDNKQAVNNNAMSNFMGEAYVTYLIDRSGALRLKLFTQTIDRFDENQGLQEYGLGVYFKEDFNNLMSSPWTWTGPKYSVKTLDNSVGLGGGYVSVTLPAGYTYSVKKAKWRNTFWMVRYPLKSNEEVQPVQPAQLVASHEHSFQWVETLEATLESDGLMQHRCECGAVDDEYPISASLVYFHEYCGAIQNAPQNAVVEWNSDPFRCYTRRMMEELAKRPDVSLKTTFTDTDGSRKSFTIPAGQAPADSELFYGFTYLGNLYGWN